MTKEKAKKSIADVGYAALWTAKQHYATFDIMNSFPTIVAVASLIISIILLAYPGIDNRLLGTCLLICSVLSLYIEKGDNEKEVYSKTANSLNSIYKELKALHRSTTDNNVKESLAELKVIDKEMEKVCLSRQIPFLSNWLAHYNMFLVSRENSRWFVDELGLTLWKDKIPESLKMIIRVFTIATIIWVIYVGVLFVKNQICLGG